MYSSEFCSVGLQVYNLKSPNLLLDEVYHNILFSTLILFCVGHIGTKGEWQKLVFSIVSLVNLVRVSLGKSLGSEGLEKSNSPL
jgi:hypothetical protein